MKALLAVVLAAAPVTDPNLSLPGESDFIYGMHDTDGALEGLFASKLPGANHGWLVLTEGIGASGTAPARGSEYDRLGQAGFGLLVRINYGYYPDGTLPTTGQYDAFAATAADFVSKAGSHAHHWIIGNETNLSVERPSGQAITAADYVSCFGKVREAIKAVPGHQQDRVLVGAVGPWNAETAPFLTYFADILNGVAGAADGIALHAYTHEDKCPGNTNDPAFITSEARGGGGEHWHFRVYQDFLAVVPASMRSLPVFVTETDANSSWLDANNGWLQAAFAEIDRWNGTGGQVIRALAPYRWGPWDVNPGNCRDFQMSNKPQLIADLTAALQAGYRWRTPAGLPDVVVTRVSLSPAAPGSGDAVSFEAEAHNQGAVATPDIVGLSFALDGAYFNYGSCAALAAGARCTITGGGGAGNPSTWTATAGGHKVAATVDDVNRFAESDETNNGRELSFIVAAAPGADAGAARPDAAAAPPDASAIADAASPRSDSGTPAAVDAGPSAGDAGATTFDAGALASDAARPDASALEPATAGCGCSSASGSSALAWTLALLLGLRRRI